MDLEYYDAFFHDGYLFNIKWEENHLQLAMESAVFLPGENRDGIETSESGSLRGILHCKNVTKIQQRESDTQVKLKMERKYAEIYDLEIQSDRITLNLVWLPGAPGQIDDYRSYVIKAEEIFWENTPDMQIPSDL